MTIEIQGKKQSLDGFLEKMHSNLPPSAKIEKLHIHELDASDQDTTFQIRTSEASAQRFVSLAPDGYVCQDCLAEMWNPSDRRYLYPFINCTHCGPRYTITKDLPYDRATTTMSCFSLCSDCQREYSDPNDRRYHAQPLACPVCGPQIWLVEAAKKNAPPTDLQKQRDGSAIELARQFLSQGKVIAIKGIGGFLLSADASNPYAVMKLRRMKNRKRKPLAVMVRDLSVARKLVHLNNVSEGLLCSPAVPIVVAPKKRSGKIAEETAPRLFDLGIMLPSTPLHHLLLGGKIDALIMTSANAASEPMIIENREALSSLQADAFLLHNRDIEVATDDSVIRTAFEGSILVRRARGFVPESMDASFLPAKSVVALGAQLKVTLAILFQTRLMVGRHLGDLTNLKSEKAFQQEFDRLLGFARMTPEAFAIDLHPDLFSTIFGERHAENLPLIRTQHHHAHFCSVLLEHGFSPEVQAVGIILDGMGYGSDGTIWGGEVLFGGYTSFHRTGHLRSVPLPGGDKAALEPHRMATSLLYDAGITEPSIPCFDPNIAKICALEHLCPMTSSAGRLFDAVAAILGVAPPIQTYEGEAASLLEAIADPECQDAYALSVGGGELDTRSLTLALLDDKSAVSVRAARFHNGLADGLTELALSHNTEIVVLAGGSMVNRLLHRRLVNGLRKGGKTVIWPQKLPMGDGGISAGQAAIAACSLNS